MAKQKYYVVWKGRHSGVFKTWKACSAQVSSFTGAEFKSFDSLEAAESAYRGAYAEFVGKKTAGNPSISSAGQCQWKTALIKPSLPSISVDAACSGVPGPVEWRGVHTESGAEIFKAGPFPDGTNNVGEFLAIVAGLRWLQEEKLNWPLYSDSKNAILWVEIKTCRTKMEHTRRNAALFEMIVEAQAWLVENSYSNLILKWETEDWGENPADFGRK